MRKLFTLFVALLATTATLWAYDFKLSQLHYDILSDSTVEVVGAEPYYTKIVIPSEVTNGGYKYKVTSIGDGAFYHNNSSDGKDYFLYYRNIKSVFIPNTVTRIGKSAFAYCESLTSIDIPNSVNSIEYSAFYHCSSLTSIIIPNSVTKLGQMAFDWCTSLTSLTLTNNISSIGAYAFRNCPIESITLTASTIEEYCMGKCNGLLGMMWIPRQIQINGENVTEIVIPESINSIINYSFVGCTSLTSVTIPNSVMSIGEGVFSGCSSLTSVTIPNSVTSIGGWAFDGCSSLTSITIPESVISIGSNALHDTPWFENVPDGVVYINNVLYTYKGSMPDDEAIDVKEGIVSISPYAFYNNNLLKSITIPSSIKYIGEYAFDECKKLKTVHILSIVPPEITTPIFASKYIPTIYVLPDAFLAYLSSWSSWSDYRDNIKTTGMEMTLDLLNRTQTTISIHASLGDLGDLTKSGGHGVQWSTGSSINPIKNYWGTITGYDCETIYFDEGMLNLDTTITNLSPNTQYAFRVFYRVTDGYNTEYIYGETKTCTTSPVVLSEPTLQTTEQTYIKVQTSSAYGDATLVEEVVEVATSKYNTPEQRVNVAGRSNVIINNLMPDTKYYFRSVLTTQEAGTMQSEWYEATTEPITLATGEADGISNSSAFLHGTIDCDTMSRTEIGFEWKRSDAPSTVKPQRLLVVDRVDENLIFRLEGLSSDRYYDFRTFCLYNGKEYYGEWVGFLTSDKDILIPPSVQTREAEITELGVLMKGFVVAGTEVILQRGFECWREESDQVATTVAEGAIMSSYVPEAWSYTTYKYRAYAKTPAGTTYGETLEVTTEYIATNIADIIVNASSNSAQVTWTMVEQADYYILTLYSDESMTEVIGVYTVDKNGNVTQKRVASATQSLVTCELTELLPETNYYFAVKAYNSDDQKVAEENGSFATTVVPTYVENTQSPMTNCQKIIRNGQLLILRDGKTYTSMGAEVK